jgi:hypothetical protein
MDDFDLLIAATALEHGLIVATLNVRHFSMIAGLMRSILRKRHKGKGRGRGLDHVKWPNRYFENLGLYSLVQAREEAMSLRKGATC